MKDKNTEAALSIANIVFLAIIVAEQLKTLIALPNLFILITIWTHVYVVKNIQGGTI